MGPMVGCQRAYAARRAIYILAVMIAAIAVAAPAGRARAFDLPDLLIPDIADTDWVGGRADAFAGMDVGDTWAFSYGGATLAPSGLDSAGLRVRFYGGAGHYTYQGVKETSPGVHVTVNRHAEVVQLEALVGWQFAAGPMIAHVYAGVAYEDHVVTPGDPGNTIEGAHLGGKIALETWVDLTRRAWLSADASYATTIDAYSGAAKLGLRPFDWLSLGPEGSVFGNREFDGHRLGGFARWHCGGCDMTVSGGISGDFEDETGAYGAISFYSRF